MDLFNQALEYAAGAHLCELGSAILYHFLDGLRPTDGSGELVDEVLLYIGGVDIWLGINVLVYGASGGIECGGCYGSFQLLAGRLHQRRVEGATHLQYQRTLGTGSLELLAGDIDTFYAAADNELAGAIIVSRDNDLVADAGAYFFDFGIVHTEYGSHGGGIELAGTLHGIGTLGYEAQAILEREGLIGDEC